ncbi:hypothetical protein [Mycobacterium sp. 852002-51057_SCH5723018]|uniref:PPE family protein, SVP subgroup n=1 Tax=Mycobacterium sp. 852002-51057_SCH5723018 TaxID=1834094 RepID=UPI0012E74E95
MTSLLTAGTAATPELGTHAFGLASDGFGLGSDISGLGLDLAGSGLEFVGSDSLVGAAEVAAPAELGAVEPLQGLGGFADPLAGADGGAYAVLGQAPSLGTLSVPPSWAEALPAASADSAGTTGLPAAHLRSIGAMVGRGSAAAAHRVGSHVFLIPRSPVGG